MSLPIDALRLCLANAATGPQSGVQLAKAMQRSQPTVSRALAALGDEVVRIGQRRSARYLLRDRARGFGDSPVFRVDTAGRVKALGSLLPVRPEGFLFALSDGRQIHSQGLPWWLLDMLPQGYLGRSYAARHARALGLPGDLKDWTDSHAIRALLLHGHDLVGNLLLGTEARDRFISSPEPECIGKADKARAYERLAIGAAQGDSPGSSAGGEQPKFTAYVETDSGGRHVIVKFSERQDSPVSQRWRDLLLAEHIALTTLRQAGFAAAHSVIVDSPEQRFLEVERFDRVGAVGRKALISLRAWDAEFVGKANQPWPVITQALAARGLVAARAVDVAQMLWAFGSLIGNSDMHAGNLSFLSEDGDHYDIAPAYDMTPMSFAPTRSGRLPQQIQPIALHASVSNAHWHAARQLALRYLAALRGDGRFSTAFGVCIDALAHHLALTGKQIDRLA